MKFVALVSGGKDSCFNILHCIENGHQLLALANLYPPEEHGSDELDSFMYQTVGYHAVELYGEALDVPLYRVPIMGKSVAQGLDYVPTLNDESEDLYMLLKTVKKYHPDVEAVSVGAILSTYQRTRVENVCSRLGLVSLAFLWQRSQAELLDEIISSGVDARIIKTAGIGLNRNHLGKSLREMRSELIRLNGIYGLHLCGEGGEYETLVFDAPIFKKRLVIVDSKVVDHSNDDVSYLSLRVRLEEKADSEVGITVIPPLLEEKFQEIHDELVKFPSLLSSRARSNDIRGTRPIEAVLAGANMSSIVNITADGDSLESEVRAVFNRLIEVLKENSLSIDDVAFVSLLLKDMTNFQIINGIYNTFFTKPNPPARFCIQAGIQGHEIQLSAVAVGDGHRDGLHVQGQSYWAPANIGPYSQAISINGLTYLAGQIGLIPASMTVANDNLIQLILSLQNISRVQECTASEPAYCVAFVSNNIDSTSEALLSKAWQLYIDSLNIGSLSEPGLLIAGVPCLPRNASYEWTCLGINRSHHIQYINEHDEDDTEVEDHQPTFIWPQIYSETLTANVTRFGYSTTITTGSNNLAEISDLIKSCSYGKLISATIYSTQLSEPTFPCELIPTNWIFYRGKSVALGATLLFTHST